MLPNLDHANGSDNRTKILIQNLNCPTIIIKEFKPQTRQKVKKPPDFNELHLIDLNLTFIFKILTTTYTAIHQRNQWFPRSVQMTLGSKCGITNFTMTSYLFKKVIHLIFWANPTPPLQRPVPVCHIQYLGLCPD